MSRLPMLQLNPALFARVRPGRKVLGALFALVAAVLWMAAAYALGYRQGSNAGWHDGASFGQVTAIRAMQIGQERTAQLLKEDW